MALFSGSIVALITPFDSKGRIDARAFRNLVRWHLEEGTDGVVCSGSTGEGNALNRKERLKLLQICLEEAKGKMQILAGTGAGNTRETVQFTEDALKAGADGALVVTPFYCRPTQEGCLAHFAEVGKVGLPVIVYHNPTRACFRFLLESLPKLAKIPLIVGIKDSNHDIEYVRSMKKICSLPLYSGDDDITLEMLEEGGVGSISVIGNFIPKGWKKMIQHALRGEWEIAKKIMHRFLPLIRANFLETNPQGIKYLVSQLGRCKPIWRLPLVPPKRETVVRIQEELFKLAVPYARSSSQSEK